METSAECICCNEIPNVLTKKQENNSSIKCITEHPGFEAVCLNVWVLQVAYFQYRQEHGGGNMQKLRRERKNTLFRIPSPNVEDTLSEK